MNAGYWHQIPVVRIFLPFVLGCGISMFYPLGLSFSLFLFAAAFLVALFTFLSKTYSGIILSIVYFTCGMALHQWQDIRNHVTYFERIEGKYLIAKIDEPPVSKKRSWKMEASIIARGDRKKTKPVSGKIIIYLKKSDSICPLNYKAMIQIPASNIKAISPPQNPDEFNYKRYLAFRHIHHQVYLQSEQLTLIKGVDEFSIRESVYELQQYFRKILATYVGNNSQKGIAQALLYGNDDEIDDETMQAYAHTGTLHVLAVSGMHVGIIFMLLNKLLIFVERLKRGKYIKAAAILIILWTYSMLCNLSPSILRATVMFTFIIASDVLKRNSNIYNTLAASALFLMLFDVNYIASVGFQLSYMAVLGIVFLQPYIYNWYTAPNTFMDQVWKISSVSIAAQIATMPIGMLYFHQFPFCFLFSNLIIIPLTNVILYGCILLVAIGTMHWPALIVGKLVSFIIQFTNIIVKFVEQLPFAYTEGIHISIIQSILLYVIILCLVAYFILYQKYLLRLSAFLSLLLLISISIHQIQNSRQHLITVYKVNKLSAIRIFKSTSSILIADSMLIADKDKMRFHLTQHKWRSGIEREQIITDSGQTITYKANERQILIAGKLNTNDTAIYKCDMVIINYPLYEYKLNLLKPKEVIFASNLSQKQLHRMQAYFNNQNIPYYSVIDSTSFQLSL
jgi:competence protein ComEC